jgi:tripartite-type tricarboxylate transporter receptor subunit TctC
VRRGDLLLGASATIIAGSASAAQDTFPDRPITITNGYGPGGSTDIATRLMIEQMPPSLGGNARFIVENRAGASGTLASAWMTRQPPDGYSLLISESSSFAIWPSMHESGTPYRPLQDFTWIATICTAPLVLLVKSDFPARNASEAFEVLRSDRSAHLDYSSSGAGSIPHIAAEMLKFASPACRRGMPRTRPRTHVALARPNWRASNRSASAPASRSRGLAPPWRAQRSDPAFFARLDGLLRCARNDG